MEIFRRRWDWFKRAAYFIFRKSTIQVIGFIEIFENFLCNQIIL